MNYSELLQLAKGWGNFISDRIINWRLLRLYYITSIFHLLQTSQPSVSALSYHSAFPFVRYYF